MRLEFTKMQALGNDFVVLDFTEHSFDITAKVAAHIADRHFGIGCDQILIVEPSPEAGIDFGYRILNADGSEVGQCGNGARCFAHFVRAKGLSDKATITVKTRSGVMHLSIDEANDFIRVDMGVPQLDAENIPLNLPTGSSYTLELDTEVVTFSAVSMGNPHAVIEVAAVEHAAVSIVGTALQVHAAFPESVNVGFMQINSREHIGLRVYERGVGETLACGSGACAAVVAGILSGTLDQTVKVDLPGGSLSVTWAGLGSSVILSGPATHVYEGCIDI